MTPNNSTNKIKRNRNVSKIVQKYYCEKCKKSFRRNQFLTLHNSVVHSDQIEKILCPLWPKCSTIKRANGYYSNKANLQNHLQKHHNLYTMPEKLKTVVFQRNESELLYSYS